LKTTLPPKRGKCRCCGCTEDDCSQCVERTGDACSWATPALDLCTACTCDVCGVEAHGKPRFVHPLIGERPRRFSNRVVQICAGCRAIRGRSYRFADPDIARVVEGGVI